MRATRASFSEVKMSSLLALNAVHRAIGDSLLCLPIQRDADRKASRAVVANDLDAARSRTRATVVRSPGTLSEGLRSSVPPFLISSCRPKAGS
jgi:hypothetical protein